MNSVMTRALDCAAFCVRAPDRSFASVLASDGATVETIGRILGHTQIGIIQRYAHRIDAPLRAGSTPWAIS